MFGWQSVSEAETWASCLGFNNFDRVVVMNHAVKDCAQFHRLDELVASVQEIAPVPINLATVKVEPRAPNNFGQENVERSMVTIALDATGLGEDSSIQNRASLIVFTHELGHLILDELLAERIHLLHQGKQVRARYQKYLRLMWPVIERRNQDESCKDQNSDCARQIADVIKSISAEFGGTDPGKELGIFSERNKAELDRITKISESYQELYADLIVSVLLDDPLATTKAEKSFGFPHQSYADSSGYAGFGECREWGRQAPVGFQSADPHCAYSAIRFALWTRLVVPAGSSKRELLKSIGQAIVEEIAMQVDSNELRYKDANAAVVGLSKRLGI